MIKIIIDTNLWISFLIGKKLYRLEELLNSHKLVIVTSTEQINEFLEVINRAKFRKYFSKRHAIRFLDLIEERSIITNHTGHIDICRDRKDNFLLNMAINSKAKFLISGDKDLLSLREIESTLIISFSEFETQFLFGFK